MLQLFGCSYSPNSLLYSQGKAETCFSSQSAKAFKHENWPVSLMRIDGVDEQVPQWQVFKPRLKHLNRPFNCSAHSLLGAAGLNTILYCYYLSYWGHLCWERVALLNLYFQKFQGYQLPKDPIELSALDDVFGILIYSASPFVLQALAAAFGRSKRISGTLRQNYNFELQCEACSQHSWLHSKWVTGAT